MPTPLQLDKSQQGYTKGGVSSMTETSETMITPPVAKSGGMRWTIVGLLFFATTVN
jgi:hypothetical protein